MELRKKKSVKKCVKLILNINVFSFYHIRHRNKKAHDNCGGTKLANCPQVNTVCASDHTSQEMDWNRNG